MRLIHACFQQDFGVGAVTLQADNIQGAGTALDDFIVIVDDRDIMFLRGQMLSELVSDLAGSDDNNPHTGPPREIKSYYFTTYRGNNQRLKSIPAVAGNIVRMI